MRHERSGPGTRRVERFRAREREDVRRLVAEVEAREAAEAEDAETEADPYRMAEQVARDLHKNR